MEVVHDTVGQCQHVNHVWRFRGLDLMTTWTWFLLAA